MGAEVRLREFREEDLPFLDRLTQEPEATGVFMFSGFRDSRSRRRRFELDGYVGTESVGLAITLADDAEAGPVGVAGWHCSPRHQAGVCYEIGVGLLPEHRGRGLGTAAHHALVSHLFRFTTAHRLEAITDAENVGEQRALERSGFRLEGRRREVYFQFGTWRDQLIYGLLRSEATVSQAVTVP
jgi:RimJ/RimL family protein N-acetyltransferase